MIPLLGEDGQGIRYLCASCARKLVVSPGDLAGDAEPAEVD